MTKRKDSSPPRPLQVRPVTIEERYIGHLEEEVKTLRHDLEFYRGKCQRFELSIMNSDTKREAAIEFVERTEAEVPRPPTIRTVAVDASKGPPPSFKLPFSKLKEEWDKLSPAQQAEQQGLPVPEDKPAPVKEARTA